MIKYLKEIYRLIALVSRGLNFTFALMCGLLLYLVAILTCVDVVSSHLFNKPIPGAVELIVLTMPWVVCLALAFALIKGAHVRVTLLYSRFPSRGQSCLDLVANLLAFLFFCVLTYGTWLHFWSSWEVREPMFAALLTLPWWLGKLALPVGVFLIAIQHFLEAVNVYFKD